MNDCFDKCFDVVVGVEGGYSNDPKDPGGETNFGLSKRAYPNLDIKNLTLDQAKQIYKADYWDKCRCSEFSPEIALIVFDCALNQGPVQAIRIVQAIVGAKVDGLVGPNTIAAANKFDQELLKENFLTERAMRYAGTLNFETYGRGWLRRLFHIGITKI